MIKTRQQNRKKLIQAFGEMYGVGLGGLADDEELEDDGDEDDEDDDGFGAEEEEDAEGFEGGDDEEGGFAEDEEDMVGFREKGRSEEVLRSPSIEIPNIRILMIIKERLSMMAVVL